jgi:hypothetical protein
MPQVTVFVAQRHLDFFKEQEVTLSEAMDAAVEYMTLGLPSKAEVQALLDGKYRKLVDAAKAEEEALAKAAAEQKE